MQLTYLVLACFLLLKAKLSGLYAHWEGIARSLGGIPATIENCI